MNSHKRRRRHARLRMVQRAGVRLTPRLRAHIGQEIHSGRAERLDQRGEHYLCQLPHGGAVVVVYSGRHGCIVTVLTVEMYAGRGE